MFAVVVDDKDGTIVNFENLDLLNQINAGADTNEPDIEHIY